MRAIGVLPTLLVCHLLVAQDPAPAAPLRLTLQEAITTALKNNLQVEISQADRDFTKAGVLGAEGAFDWNLSGSLSWKRQESGSANGNHANDLTTQSRSLSAGLDKAFDWGGALNLEYAPSYRLQSYTLSGAKVSPYPYSGAFTATYTQNLLKGFGRQVSDANLIVARKSAQAADYQFQKEIIKLVADTEAQYWDVVNSQKKLENKKQALALAEKQLRENKIRVEVGTMAPIEVTSAEAAVAQREQEIISAEADLLNARDALIQALFPRGNRPASLEPTDAPALGRAQMSEAEAERMALEHRVELKGAQLDLESKQVLEGAAKNGLLPTLNATVGYTGDSASWDGLSNVNKDLTKATYPGYSASLQFAMPVFNRAAKGKLIQARANRRSSELGLKDLQLGIKLEARTAVRNLEAAEKSVKAAEKTRIFREKDLEAEQKKFENGMSTNFLVLSKQNDLDSAKAQELQAQITYMNAVTSLEKALGNLLEARKLEVK